MNEKQTVLYGKNISKQYGGVTVLDGIDIDIYAGDFTVIMGSSGSGKSTLLHCLSGMEQRAGGEICCGEVSVTNATEKELENLRADRFGFVFQKTHLVSNLTLYENILMAGLISSSLEETEVWKKADMLVEQMHIEEAKDRLPAVVSGGEAQRAAVARAVMGAPDILFADEPTGALNKANTKEVLDLFTALNKNGQTILLVTHDREAALRGNRILYLEDGKIISALDLPPYSKRDEKREKSLSTWLEEQGW